MIQGIKHRCLPFHRIGTPTGLHIEQANLVIGSLRDVTFTSSRPTQPELHIRLTGAKPYFASQYLIIYKFLFTRRNFQGIRAASFQRFKYHTPLSIGSSFRLFLLTGNLYSYLFSGIGFSVNGQRLSMLQHHIVGIHIRHLQATKITGYAFIYRLGQDGSSFCIRMHRIFQNIRIRIKRFMEINQLHTFRLGYTFDGQLNFSMPITSTRFKTIMTVGQWCHSSQQETNLRIHLTEGLHQRTIITDEFIPIVRPISRVCIVDTQMNHHDVTGKSQSILIFLLLSIWTMSLI